VNAGTNKNKNKIISVK